MGLSGKTAKDELGIESVRNEEALHDEDPEHVGHEDELTAGRRLIDSLHDSYGGFIDAIAPRCGGSYRSGPLVGG
jgi:hypothetical protein